MKQKSANPTWLIVAAVAFWAATVISAWRMISGDVEKIDVIPAICFPLAAILLSIAAMRARRGRSPGSS